LSSTEKLQILINDIDDLTHLRWNDPRVEAWKNSVLRFFKKEFGEKSDYYKQIESIIHGPIIISAGTPDSVFQKDYINDLKEYKVHLESYLAEIKEEYKVQPSKQLSQSDTRQPSSNMESDAVFIIHGHDEINTLKLKSLLKERWKLNPILLTERPAMGRTIIEKFEDEAKKACYAFAILTPDDMVKGSADDYRQSRPNVFFELGWFYCHIGRENVCILFKKGTRIHSDLEGMSLVKFDKEISDRVIDIENELKEAHVIK
jgi:predicted nucleotide-binding protein